MKRKHRSFGGTRESHTKWAKVAGSTIKTMATRAVIQAKKGNCTGAFSPLVNMNRAVGAEFAHTQESGGEVSHPSRSVVAPKRAHAAFARYCLRD